MIIEIDAELAAALNFKLTHPAIAVRQKNLERVMSRIEFNDANRLRRVALRTTVDDERESTGVG